ncbi:MULTISPECIES: ArsR family transcriptional regulator [unclassified Clostridium]|jgi:hypothetical protein|nr:ArsR family transcriptional regulator [Candidatus Izemoplasmatales bacterium]
MELINKYQSKVSYHLKNLMYADIVERKIIATGDITA